MTAKSFIYVYIHEYKCPNMHIRKRIYIGICIFALVCWCFLYVLGVFFIFYFPFLWKSNILPVAGWPRPCMRFLGSWKSLLLNWCLMLYTTGPLWSHKQQWVRTQFSYQLYCWYLIELLYLKTSVLVTPYVLQSLVNNSYNVYGGKLKNLKS